MPLLGRHKLLGQSSTTAASTSSSSPAANTSNRTTCESPMFGVRTQISLAAVASANEPVASPARHKQQQPQAAGPHSGAQLEATSNDSTSIPQHITKQQIHYAFEIMDTNSDGMIDVRDFSQMLANLGVPIDEAILAHLVSNASKRGDHRICETEFLEWISNFIIVSECSTTTTTGDANVGGKSGAGGNAKNKAAQNSGKKSKVARSPTVGASLVASDPNACEPPATGSLRNRRGSGSGLALMRSLSAGSGEAIAAASTADSSTTSSTSTTTAASSRASSPKQQQQDADTETRNDLKAAFCVFDLDGDGYITIDEVRAGLKLLGESWSPSELRALFSQCAVSSASSRQNDLNNNNNNNNSQQQQQQQRISIDEFVQLLL